MIGLSSQMQRTKRARSNRKGGNIRYIVIRNVSQVNPLEKNIMAECIILVITVRHVPDFQIQNEIPLQ
jgi:hypothetical protein